MINYFSIRFDHSLATTIFFDLTTSLTLTQKFIGIRINLILVGFRLNTTGLRIGNS